jgi:hypothetical protein
MYAEEFASDNPVAVGAVPLTAVFDRRLNGLGEVNIEIDNRTAGAALTACEVQLRDHSGGEWYPLLAGTDFDAVPLDRMPFCYGTAATDVKPYMLAAGKKAHLTFRPGGAQAFRVVVTGNGAVVIVRGTHQRQGV